MNNYLDVNKLIKEMSVEEKVAQMLFFAFHGTEFNSDLEVLTKEINVGGIIHFARNIINPEQVNKLNKDIQDHSKIPAFIGIDQEGGVVQRIIDGVTPFPGAMAVSASGYSSYELTKSVGTDLRNMNYNMVFAPVADVNNNPLNPVINSRSFGDDPNEVSKHVYEAWKGFDDSGIIPTLKHFPGHGDTSVDSHISLPTVNKTKAELEEIELVPFKENILKNVPGIMVSHVLYKAFDDVYPATLSKNILNDYLKDELGYEGLIISDSLTMGAIQENFGTREIIKQSCNAGLDLLMFCGKAGVSDEVNIFNTFVSLVKSGEISIDRVNYSVRKILNYKNKYCFNSCSKYVYPSKESIEYGLLVSDNSTTLVKANGLIPLRKEDKALIIFPRIRLFSLVENENDEYATFGSILKKYGYDYDELIVSEELLDIETIKDIQKKYNKIIFATYNIREGDYQTKIYDLLDKEKVIAISMRSPYDIKYLPNVLNYICIYEPTKLALNSLALNIIGQRKFAGKLPVKLDN